MTDTSNKDETVVTEPPKNDDSGASTQQGNASETAEAGELKLQLEKARLREKQLENQIKKDEEAKEAARLKQLEEQNEWKQIAEQEKAKREELETQAETERRTKELKQATDTVLNEYPDAVKEIAEEAGLTALDSSEEEVAKFKSRLDKIKSKLPQAQVGANNPANPTTTNKKLSGDEMKLALKNQGQTHELLSQLKTVQPMLTKRPQ